MFYNIPVSKDRNIIYNNGEIIRFRNIVMMILFQECERGNLYEQTVFCIYTKSGGFTDEDYDVLY